MASPARRRVVGRIAIAATAGLGALTALQPAASGTAVPPPPPPAHDIAVLVTFDRAAEREIAVERGWTIAIGESGGKLRSRSLSACDRRRLRRRLDAVSSLSRYVAGRRFGGTEFQRLDVRWHGRRHRIEGGAGPRPLPRAARRLMRSLVRLRAKYR